MTNRSEQNDFPPTASIENLQARSEIIARINQFFRERQLIHVETPLLSRDTVVDRYLHPIKVDGNAVLRKAIPRISRSGCKPRPNSA